MHTLALLALILAAQDAGAAKTVEVRGVVRDEAGQPLADVMVVALGVPRTGSMEPQLWQATTDAQGRYELPAIEVMEDRLIALYALKRGFVARQKTLEQPSEPVEWTLSPAKSRTVVVQDPEGKPLEGVVPTDLTFSKDREYVGLSEDVISPLGLRSDAEGKLTIAFAQAQATVSIALSSPKFGRQQTWLPAEQEDLTFRFLPVGSLVGKVAAPQGHSTEGVKVQVRVTSAANPRVASVQTVPVGAEGRFELPAVMAGTATLSAVLPGGSELRGSQPVEVKIEADQQSEARMGLVLGTRITGTVVSLDDDQPIAGAKLYVWNNTTRESQSDIVTDKQGRYTAFVGPGQVGARVQQVPLPHYVGVSESASVIVKESDTSAELPPIKLPRGVDHKGLVVDEQGNPVAKAWVSASWWEEQNRVMTTGARSVQTDDDGRFVLKGVSSRVEIYLRADTPEAAGLEYTTVPVGNRDEIRLSISPKGVAVIAGRVVDPQGQPIEGAQVEINAGYRRTSNSELFSGERLEWHLKTDAEGRFETPRAVPRHLQPPGRLGQLNPAGYYVRATSPGRLDSTVTVTVGPEGDPFTMPDIVLTREGRVAGRVVDRQGQPVEGVRLWAAGLTERQTVSAMTNADGRFEITKVHPDALFVFAEHKDFAFVGHPIGEGDVTMTLARKDEAESDPPLVPQVPSPDESAKALKTIFLPLWDKLDPREHAYQRSELLQRMVLHDEEWALAKLPELPSARYVLPVLQKLGRTEDALQAVAAMSSPYQRSYTLVDLARGTADANKRQTMMGEAFAEAKSVIAPNQRLAAMMKIAEALRDFGEEDAARRIVEENLPEMEKLEAGFWRGYVAETVALFNLDKALALCEGATDEYERDRHPGNIAHKLAGIDPEKAERAYKLVSDNNQYRYVPRVCYRMAPVDFERAKRIADAAGRQYGDQRPYTYGVMALALVGKDPDQARALVREAFMLLRAADPRVDNRQRFTKGTALLRIAETVDPGALRAYFWQVVSLAPGTQMRTAYEWEAEQKMRHDAQLAVLLARYGQFPEIAQKLVEPLYTTDKISMLQMHDGVFPFAMAAVDPDKATRWLADKYFPGTTPEQRRYIPQPQEVMADAVGGDDEAYWKAMHSQVLHLWLPDEYD